jgi:hypothetical protein
MGKNLDGKIEQVLTKLVAMDIKIGEITNDDLVAKLWKDIEAYTRMSFSSDFDSLMLHTVRTVIDFINTASIDVDDKKSVNTVLTSLGVAATDVGDAMRKYVGNTFYVTFNEKYHDGLLRYRNEIVGIMEDEVNSHKIRFINISRTFLDKLCVALVKTYSEELAKLKLESKDEELF